MNLTKIWDLKVVTLEALAELCRINRFEPECPEISLISNNYKRIILKFNPIGEGDMRLSDPNLKWYVMGAISNSLDETIVLDSINFGIEEFNELYESAQMSGVRPDFIMFFHNKAVIGNTKHFHVYAKQDVNGELGAAFFHEDLFKIKTCKFNKLTIESELQKYGMFK